MTFTFSLKQGQTRKSSGPVWVPLKVNCRWDFFAYRFWKSTKNMAFILLNFLMIQINNLRLTMSIMAICFVLNY